MDVQGLLDWLTATCKDARIAALEGDVSKANQLARVPALRDYFNNVVMTEKISGETFIQWYPTHAQTLNSLYEDYQKQAQLTEQVTAQDTKLKELSDKFEIMKAEFAALQESLAEKPAKRKPRKTQEPEPESPAADTAAEEDSEDESETTED